ncbi:MAG: hypothetical protein FWF36_09955 [Propionibacteriaceae bacterium]|nr:hypothetical protein [Propionibacteriaceae bacterium]
MQGATGFPAPAPKKKNTGLIVGIIVLVVLIVAALIGFRIFSSSNQKDAPVPAGQAKTADEAVVGYLNALAAGNSADALAFLDSPPTDTSLLTDDVLAYSNAINPISNVTTDSSTGYSVAATYNIGSQSVTANFYVQQYGKYYKLTSNDAVSSVYIPSPPTGVSMTINGIPATVTNYSVTLFPGYYEVAIDNSLVTVSNGNFFVSGSYSGADTSNMSYDLSSDAQGQFQQAATAQLDACMAEQDLETSCSFGLSDPHDRSGNPIDVNTSTIQWSFSSGSSDDFSSVNFSWYGLDGLTATAYRSITLTVNLDSTSGDGYYKDVYLSEIDVDFSDPSNLVVSFS